MTSGFSKRSGFTLVEMVLVVVIIGVLAGMMMVSSGDTKEKANYSRAEQDLDSLVAAMGIAYENYGSFGSVGDGNLSSAFNTSGFKDAFERNLVWDLDDIKDPWKNEYKIESDYNENDGTGAIWVYCADAGGSNVRKNRYNNDREMKRRIYDGGD